MLLAEGLLPANQKRAEPYPSHMTRFIRGSEAGDARDHLPAFCKLCGIRNKANKSSTMYVSKKHELICSF